MTKPDNSALVPSPPGALEKAKPGSKRILSGIVADTLALARVESEAEQWCLLGESYHYGIGRASDSNEAVKWFRMAAEKGHARAQCWLGYCYQHASGLKEDLAEGVRWIQKAANQEDAVAQYNLGVCFEGGLGVPQNLDEIVSCYRKAADNGHLGADFRLGVHLTTPPAANTELDEGLVRLERAAEKGHVESQILLGSLRGSLFKDYAAQLRWYGRAAQQGSMEAEARIGICYEKGEGVPQDYSEAVARYQKAASERNRLGQYRLGKCYDAGIGVSRDLHQAIRLYHLAAQGWLYRRGLPEAQRRLASCYEQGVGLRKNFSEARRWYEAAAEQDDLEAQRRLVIRLLRDYPSSGLPDAFKWLSILAEGSGQNAVANEVASLRSSMTPEQLADGEKRLREYKGSWEEKRRFLEYQERPLKREYRSAKSDRLGSLRIVMMDDEPFVSEAMAMMLEFDLPNAEIWTFTDVDAALEELEREDPDLFTTDYAHPKIKGDELVRILAARKVKYPILMLSAYAEAVPDGVLNEFFENPLLKFSLLAKPFLLDDLRRLMEKHLGPDYGRASCEKPKKFH